MDCFLDPYVVALPNLPANAKRLDDYAEALGIWSAAVKDKTHKIMFSADLISLLVDCKQYPWRDAIKDLAIQQESILTAHDIFQTCEKIINSSPLIEENIPKGVRNNHNILDSVILPKKIEDRLHENVANELKKILFDMSIACELYNHDVLSKFSVATLDLDEPDKYITVNLKTQPKENNSPEIKGVEKKWRYVLHPDELDDVESWENLWIYTQRSLQRAYRQLCKERAINPETQICPEPFVGKEFNSVILRDGLYKDETLMKALFRNTILALIGIGGFERHKNTDRNKHHPLKNEGNQIQREDGATAWRVHLSGVHRLHYWLLPDGNAELSVVTDNQHEDFYIE